MLFAYRSMCCTNLQTILVCNIHIATKSPVFFVSVSKNAAKTQVQSLKLVYVISLDVMLG